MTDNRDKEPNRDRISMIRAVTTPLGFFVLVLLIAEGILAANAVSAGEEIRRFLILGMMALVFCLVAIVAIIAVRNPGVLTGGLPIVPSHIPDHGVSETLLRNVADTALAQVLIGCSASAGNRVPVADLVETVQRKLPDVPRSLLCTAVESHLGMLTLLGAIKRTNGTLVPTSALAAGFSGCLSAHLQDGQSLFSGWDEQTDSQDFPWLRDTLRTIEERRVMRRPGQATSSRAVRSVLLLIKARHSDEDVFLMEYNPTWDGGMWWFIGGIVEGDSAPVRFAAERIKEELGISPDSFHVLPAPIVDEVRDKRISERLGLLTEYRFAVCGASLHGGGARMVELSHMESTHVTRQGKIAIQRRFRWLSWRDIVADHPLSEHAGSILSALDSCRANLPISAISVTTEQPRLPATRNRGCPYDAVLVDAGGVLFREDFWLTKARKHYSDFRTALGQKGHEITFSHYAVIARNMSLLTQASPGTDSAELVRHLYSAYGVAWSPQPAPPKGLLLPGVLPVLSALRQNGVRVYVLTNATMSGEEFVNLYGRILSTESGEMLVSGCVTSRDMGATKLCPHLYRSVLGMYGLAPQRTLMVVHDLHEILGARYAGGLHVAAVNVHHTERHIAKEFAHVVLDRFEDVVALLGQPRES